MYRSELRPVLYQSILVCRISGCWYIPRLEKKYKKQKKKKKLSHVGLVSSIPYTKRIVNVAHAELGGITNLALYMDFVPFIPNVNEIQMI